METRRFLSLGRAVITVSSERELAALEAVAFHVAASSSADSLVFLRGVDAPSPCPSPGAWHDSTFARLRAAFNAGVASQAHAAERAKADSFLAKLSAATGEPRDSSLSLETYVLGRLTVHTDSSYRVGVTSTHRPHPPRRDDSLCWSMTESVFRVHLASDGRWIVTQEPGGLHADGPCT
jgi:hypothetical protein